MSTGSTCTSCGILKAHTPAGEPPAARGGIVVLMTDGQQTVGGNDNDAIDVPNYLQNDGYTVVATTTATVSVMQAMATAPPEVHALDAQRMTIDQVFELIDPTIDALCTEVRCACSEKNCHDLSIKVRGRGFVASDDASLWCKVGDTILETRPTCSG